MSQKVDKLVEENLNLVHYLIRKNFKVSSDLYEDCFQEGCLGLCLAAERFDESKGNKFATYASSYIIGYIQTFLRKDTLIKVPRSSYELNLKILRLQENGLTDEEILDTLNITGSQYQEALGIRTVVSLETPIGDEENLTLGDMIGAEPEGNVEELEECVLLAIEEILRGKSQKIRDVCQEWIFSKMWMDEEPTQQYLGKKYGLSQGYVSRIRTKFDKELKEKLKWLI